MARADTCFHCALPIPANCDIRVEIGGEQQPVCCPGCKAVATLIRDAGLESYYDSRERPEPGAVRPADDVGEWEVFDREDMLAAFATREGDKAEATVYVGGMYCAACSWLIDAALRKLPGIASADINPATHRLRVTWDTSTVGLGRILATLADLGYKPQPLAPDSTERPERAEQRTALKRLLVASLGMMQVMMFAVALYSGEFQGIDADMERFLRLVSFLVTTPVVFYSARPFFAGAIRGLRARRPGMDVPVSIAIGSAYVASVYATYTNGPAVWYDSVTMFVFFLTVARYLEMRARHRSVDRSVALASLLPNTATLLAGGSRRQVPVAQLGAGDIALVRAGESFPADGSIIDGRTSVDESMLTGESRPQPKTVGDPVMAGSVNIDGIVKMRVDVTGTDTTLGTIGRLSERARYARPAFVQLADRVASYIVVAILVVAMAVATGWYLADPGRAFVITLSVLVVTCPCALALATPTAFAAAGGRLADLHLLVTNGNAIEILSRATHIVFDKTGTLTRGMPEVVKTLVHDPDFSEQDCLQIAAALELASTHPIARAFAHYDSALTAIDPALIVGAGVAGVVNGRHWKLGNAAFVPGVDSPRRDDDATQVFLGTDGRVVATFTVADTLRADAANTLKLMEKMGYSVSLVSGDAAAPVAQAAASLGIDDARSGCTPDDKLERIQALQKQGEVVVMVGDGINDAPVLAGADVSIAPSHAASLAQSSADVLMLGDSLRPIVTLMQAARRTMRVVRQNLAWAIVYNLSAIPLAAAGFVPPWLAAIGMSTSSLVVVMNALRLSRIR
ncbi:MAG: cadmium-translocating P-type ATPase [Gammaproteobacteria bacterium]|jgi:Cu2+-exporting ATPase|nr:cadmium-translocating P-type ATPase [Gammaproteobacteria bacterium]